MSPRSRCGGSGRQACGGQTGRDLILHGRRRLRQLGIEVLLDLWGSKAGSGGFEKEGLRHTCCVQPPA